MSPPRLWTRDFILVSAINFLLILIFYLLVVVIGLYATRELGASLSQAGLAVGIFIVGTLLGRLCIGQLIDSLGRRRILLCGLVMSIATCLLYFLELGIAFLLLNRFLHGVALGVASTATGTVVAQLIPDRRKAEGIGYFSMSTTLASAIGPFIGLSLLQSTGFRAILAVCCTLALAALLLGLALRVPELPTRQRPQERVRFSLTRLVEPRAVPIGLITLLIAFCYSGVLSYISDFAERRGLVEAASLFFVVYSLAVLASRPFSGRLLDARGANLIMYPGFVLLSLGLALLASAHSGGVLLLAGALIGLGFGNMQSSTQAIAVMQVGPQAMGLATSTFFIFLDVGLGFGPYLLGLIISHSGYATLYAMLAALALLGIPLYHLLHGRQEGVRQAHSF